MNLSFSTTVCPKAELPEALEICKAAGFDKIELFRTWTESSPVHDNTSVPMVRDRLKNAGVTLTGLNIRNITGRKADSDERDLGYNLRQISWDMHLAKALGLNTANTKGGQRTDEALEDLIEGVNSLLDRFDGFTLNLGNHAGNRLQGLEDYKAVMPNVNERAKVLLDSGHLLTAGEDIIEFATEFADRIGLVHLRDQKGDTPVPFGEGDLPFEELIAILKGAGYDGTLVVELEKVTWGEPAESVAAAREYIEQILAS